MEFKTYNLEKYFMKFKILLCRIFGHKVSRVQLAIFEIKNNPVNIERHGYSSITCPRCLKEFNPDPKKE